MPNPYKKAKYPASLPRVRVSDTVRSEIIQIAKESERSINDIQREALEVFLELNSTKRKINPS